MTPIPGPSEAGEAIKERLTPALDALEENLRHTRRALIKGRHAAEDFVADTALQVRRHPLGAVALMAGVGLIAGGVLGFVLGRQTNHRR